MSFSCASFDILWKAVRCDLCSYLGFGEEDIDPPIGVPAQILYMPLGEKKKNI